MKKDEHNSILTALRKVATDPDSAKLIMQLEQDYSGVLSERDTAQENAKKAEEQATKWAKLNNEMWLENSNPKYRGKETNTANADEPPTDEPPKKRSYEDLENEF